MSSTTEAGNMSLFQMRRQLDTSGRTTTMSSLQQHRPACNNTVQPATTPSSLQQHCPACNNTVQSATTLSSLQQHCPACNNTVQPATTLSSLQQHCPACGVTCTRCHKLNHCQVVQKWQKQSSRHSRSSSAISNESISWTTLATATMHTLPVPSTPKSFYLTLE